MNKFKKRFTYFLSAALFAYGHFIISQYIFVSVAGENILTASIWNVGLILFFIVWDKCEDFIYRKLAAKYKAHGNVVMKVANFYFGGVSFKSALYLFYTVILVLTIVARADPERFNEAFVAYLVSVESGILVLFAADQFLKQLFAESDKEKLPTDA